MREGWDHHKVDEFCMVTDYVANGSFASLKENVQYLDQPDFAMLIRYTDHAKGWNGRHKYVSESAYRFLRKSSLKPGDLIMANVGDPGSAFLLPDLGMPTTLGPNSILIRAEKEKTSNEFLHYFFLSHEGRQLIDEISAGAAQKKFNKTSFRELTIPLPPLEEQQRIVAVLDEAFAGLARARAHAEVNLQNARELFERQLGEYFSETPSDWVSQKLEAITTKIGSGATPKGGAGAYKTEGISLIRSLNVHDRWFKTDKLAFIDDEQADKLSNVVVEERDVLLNITGASIARGCVVPSKYLPARVNQHVSIVRPNHKVLSPEFLTLMLTSQPYKDGLLKTGEDNGSTRQALTKAQIQNLEVAFPPEVAQQEEAVLALEAAEQKSKKLVEAYKAKLQDIDDLRQSLLQKAFVGELTR